VTITLYKFGPQWGIADPSPYCVKLESYLRFAGIEYTAPNFKLSFFKMAPKGKFPFVKTEEGKVIGDSNLIIDDLIHNGAKNPDAVLSVEEKAISKSFHRLLDENFYWALLYSRWIDEPGWTIVSDMFFGDVPKLMRPLVEKKQQKKILSYLYGQGIGRHSHDEIMMIARQDIQALSDYLGDKNYFFGKDSLTFIDLCLHSYIINMVEAPIENDLKKIIMEKDNLISHARRIQSEIYDVVEQQKAAA